MNIPVEDRIEINILLFLSKSNKISAVNPASIYEIMDAIQNTQYHSVYKYLQKFLKIGYIDYGIKRGKRKTFYLTNEGLNAANQVRKFFKENNK